MTMNILKNQYARLFVKLGINNDDVELAHVLEDKIYEKFVKDIVSGKFKSITQVKNIAKDIKKNIINVNRKKWYA